MEPSPSQARTSTVAARRHHGGRHDRGRHHGGRRVGAVVGCIAALLIGLPSVAAAACVTLIGDGQWLQGRGVDVRKAGTCGFDDYQCVNLAWRQYNRMGWGDVGRLCELNCYAKDMWVLLPRRGFQTQAQGAITTIAPGDLIVHDTAGVNSGDGGAGHVAVVDSVDCTNGTVQIVEQNASSTGRGSYGWSGGQLSRSGFGAVLGVVHAPANTFTGCTRGGLSSSPVSVSMAEGAWTFRPVDFSFTVTNSSSSPITARLVFLAFRDPWGSNYDHPCENGRNVSIPAGGTWVCRARGASGYGSTGTYRIWPAWEASPGNWPSLGPEQTFALNAPAAPLAVSAAPVVSFPEGSFTSRRVSWDFTVTNRSASAVTARVLTVAVRDPQGGNRDVVCGERLRIAAGGSHRCQVAVTGGFPSAGTYTWWLDWMLEGGQWHGGQLGPQRTFSLATAPFVVPGAPTITGVVNGDRTVTVTFTPPANTGSSAVSTYQYSIDNGTTWTNRVPASTVSPLVISGLTNGTTYVLRIRAVNAQGPGAASNSLSAVPVLRYTLDVKRTGKGAGRVTASAGGIDCGSACTAQVTAGTRVTLTAVASAGSRFAGWSGSCSGSSSTCTVTLSRARSVTARFDVLPSYTLSVSRSGSGTGSVGGVLTGSLTPTVIDCGTLCRVTRLSGTSITLTAFPAPGAIFAGWSGSCSGTSRSCTVTLSRARSVTARFDVAPPGLTSCEGLDTSLKTGYYYTGAVCSYPWAMIESSDFAGRPRVFVDLIRTDQRRVVATWWEVQLGPRESGYSVSSLRSKGVPAAVAQLLFDRLDACKGCAYRS